MNTTPHRNCFLFPIVLLMVVAQTKEGFGQVYDDEPAGCGAAASATGNCSAAIGDRAEASNTGAAAFGYSAEASGEYSVGVGIDVEASGSQSMAIFNHAIASGTNSLAIGYQVQASNTNSIVIGSAPSNLVNASANTLMMGMNSNVPSFYMSDAGGGSNFSNIGIATINPISRLHVNGTIRTGTPTTNGSVAIDNTSGSSFSLTAPSTMANQPLILPVTAGVAGEILGLDAGGLQLKWLPGTSGGAGWLLVGNGGTNISTNFLGTTDPMDFAIRTNNIEAIRVLAGSGSVSGNVGIGTDTPTARLHVEGATEQTARFNMTGTTSANQHITIGNENGAGSIYAGYVRGTNDQVADNALRIEADVTSSANSGTNPAMVFKCTAGGSDVARPLFSWSNNSTVVMRMTSAGNLGINHGSAQAKLHVLGDAIVESGNVGIGLSTVPGARLHVASGNVFLATNVGNMVGIGTTTPSGRLHVNGTMFINSGSVPASSTVGGSLGSEEDLGINVSTGQIINLSTSSIHFKDNVENIEFDKEAFLNLRPVDYNWKEFYGGHSDVGLIAQEVAETFPPLASWSHRYTYLDNGDLLRDSMGIAIVDTNQLEVSGVRYHKLPVYLLAIAKDQQQELLNLRDQIQELNERLDGCCASVTPMSRLSNEPTQQAQMKEHLDEFILLQNDPNPFGDHTDIHYQHDDCLTCEIIISDISGKIIKRIKTTGSNGTVRIYSSEIGAGMFIYSLVMNGQTVRSERMVSSNR